MNINTNKLASNSNAFLKKLKDISGTGKNPRSEEKMSKKLKNDFFDIKSTNKNFKNRIINNNKRLSNYEYEMTKLQFIQTKVNEVDSYYHSNELDKVEQTINNTIFDIKEVLKEYFNSQNNILDQIENTRSLLNTAFKNQEKEFKAIQIASQNILSINSYSTSYNEMPAFDHMEFNQLIETSNIDNKRVMDLIS